MKRSTINQILKNAEAFLQAHQFLLPAWAQWSLQDWEANRSRIREIIACSLGWDITDFGTEDFDHSGLVLFALRNGDPTKDSNLRGKNYAEKILISQVNQVTPLHFHWRKTEDIINRGGGRLAIEIHPSTNDKNLGNDAVRLMQDGMEVEVAAGAIIELAPGESLTIPTRVYHAFRALDSPVLIGEVSSVNDDRHDNHFLKPAGRFPQLTEDEVPYRLLVSDYDDWLK